MVPAVREGCEEVRVRRSNRKGAIIEFGANGLFSCGEGRLTSRFYIPQPELISCNSQGSAQINGHELRNGEFNDLDRNLETPGSNLQLCSRLNEPLVTMEQKDCTKYN